MCVLTLKAVLAGQGSDDPSRPAQTVYEKEYINPVYGYRILIPSGLRAVGNSPPSPNHGVEIQIPAESSIFVDGHYIDEDTLEKAAAAILSAEKRGCGALENLRESATRLVHLRALRMQYDCMRPQPRFKVSIIARRTVQGYSPMLYEIGLETLRNGQSKENALTVLEKIRSQFELLPLK